MNKESGESGRPYTRSGIMKINSAEIVEDNEGNNAFPEKWSSSQNSMMRKVRMAVMYVVSGISFTICCLDFLYAFRAPFYHNWMLSVLALLVVRHLFSGLAAVFWVKFSPNHLRMREKLKDAQNSQGSLQSQ